MSEFSKGKWPLFAATVGTMCGGTTITTYSQSFFVGPVTQDLGWSFAQFFLGFTILACSGLIAGPLIGSLVPRFGIRKLAIFGLFGHALGYQFLALNPNSLLLWYFSFFLLSLLAAGTLPIIWTAVLNSWFFKRRGLAVGITMSGTGLSAFLLPPAVDALIGNFGWRMAYSMLGLGATMLSLPIVYFLFKENTELTPEAGTKPIAKWGRTRGEAMRSSKFWILCAVLFFTAFAVIGMVSHFKPIFTGKGVDASTIAKLGAIMGITVLVGRLMVGALVDRFWAPAVAAVFMLMPIMSVLLLNNLSYSFGIGVLVAIGLGLAAGAELDLLAFLTSKYFGPKHYAEIFGAVFAIFAFGAGLAPAVFGLLASNTGNYIAPLYLSLGFFAVSIILFLSLGAYPEEALEEAGEP